VKTHPLRKKIADFPTAPGVYQFVGADGAVLYVGKALNLRDRVRSYFANDTGRGPAIEEMVALATDLRVISTDSEIEAIILESNLIRKLKPKYNVIGKDDRSSWFIVMTSEDVPRVHLVRAQEVPVLRSAKGLYGRGAKYFGPYHGVGNMPSVIRALRRIWPHRDCSLVKFERYQKLNRPCLFGQIGLCPAPCVNPSTVDECRRNGRQLASFLSGRKQGLIDELRTEMELFAKREEYEQASVARDRLFALEHMKQLVNRGLLEGFAERRERLKDGLVVEAYDISNIQGEYAVGVLVRAIIPRDHRGILLAKPNMITLTKERYRKFRIKWVVGANDPEMLAEVLTRRFRRALREPIGWSLPDLILVDGGTTQLAAVRQVAKTAGVTTPIVAVAKGPTRKKVDLHIRPADESRLPLNRDALSVTALMLREEAHRFAISYYRKVHRRAAISSMADVVPDSGIE